MNRQATTDFFKALIPIFASCFSLMVFIMFVKTFVYCDWGNCDSIPQNLFKALPVEKPENFLPLDSDTPVMVKEKENRSYQYNSLRFSGRITWTVLASTHFIFCGISLFAALYIINLVIKNNKNKLAIIISYTALAVMTGWILYSNPELILRTIIQISMITIESDTPDFFNILNFLTATSFTSVILLMLAEVQVLLPQHNLTGKEFFGDISRRANHLRLILIVSTLLLVSTILSLQATLRWAAAFLAQDPATLSTSNLLIQNLTTLWAIEFTALLAAGYLPGYFLLKSMATNHPKWGTFEKESGGLKDIGLSLTTMEILSRIFAIIAPLIASPIFDAIVKIV